MQTRRSEIQLERSEICGLRNEYCEVMGRVWDNFERHSKMRVEYELDSDGNVVRDADGRPNDLSGNNPFETKSKIFEFLSFCAISVIFSFL